MPLKRRRAVYAACALAALAAPGPAHAVSSGVHIDPSSPPGKEYAIPLQTARSQGDGPAPQTARKPNPTPSATRPPAAPRPGAAAPSTPAPSRPRGAPASAPAPAPPRPTTDDGLFGAGISRPDPRSPPPTRPTNRTAPASPPAPQTLVPAAERRPVVGGGPVVLFWVVAALALLAPGLVVGVGVRRWRRA